MTRRGHPAASVPEAAGRRQRWNDVYPAILTQVRQIRGAFWPLACVAPRATGITPLESRLNLRGVAPPREADAGRVVMVCQQCEGESRAAKCLTGRPVAALDPR
jgi:hypothetical protein